MLVLRYIFFNPPKLSSFFHKNKIKQTTETKQTQIADLIILVVSLLLCIIYYLRTFYLLLYFSLNNFELGSELYFTQKEACTERSFSLPKSHSSERAEMR